MRWFASGLVGVLLVVSHASPASAAKPQKAPTGQPANDVTLSVLNAEEAAALETKLARAAEIEAMQADGFTIQSCPTPESAPTTADSTDAATATSACTPATYTLPTYARQQATGYYCGPASGQVVSNYSWGLRNSSTGGTSTTNNKYTQNKIASWMSTTTSGTSGANLATGLNSAAKLPSGFAYAYVASGTGSQLHGKVVHVVYDWKMPLVLPVKPHDPGALYRLTSWPTAIQAWHWITLRGYSGFWDGTRNPKIYYNDSSYGYYGSTGAFVDPSYDVHYVNKRNTGNIVW